MPLGKMGHTDHGQFQRATLFEHSYVSKAVVDPEPTSGIVSVSTLEGEILSTTTIAPSLSWLLTKLPLEKPSVG